MTSVTEQTARLIRGFQASALPEEALRRARIAVMDCVGVALAGFREPVSGIVRDFAIGMPGGGEATIWGTAHKVAALEAALVNGTMSHALDYDDMNRSMLGHPSAVLAPALFAVAEKWQLSGRRLLEGYIIGLEVMARLGRIFGPQAYEKSWHPTAIFGVIGACAGASYLLRLSYDQTVNAIGIAASEASGIKKNFGSMTKPLHAGSAARKGMWAALLAEKGLTAGSQALDGRFGFLEMFNGKTGTVQASSGGGEPLEILKSGLVFKQYPCCGGLHSLLDNVISLRQKEGIRPEQVAEIECRVHPHKVAYLDRPQVREGLEAKFSIQYCVAAALSHGKVGLNHFSDESVVRPEAQALMKKIRVTAGDDLEGFASEVIVRDAAGRQFSSRLPEPRGSQNHPLSEAELLQKFADCAMLIMSASRAEKAGEALMGLDREDNVQNVLAMLASD